MPGINLVIGSKPSFSKKTNEESRSEVILEALGRGGRCDAMVGRTPGEVRINRLRGGAVCGCFFHVGLWRQNTTPLATVPHVRLVLDTQLHDLAAE